MRWLWYRLTANELGLKRITLTKTCPASLASTPTPNTTPPKQLNQPQNNPPIKTHTKSRKTPIYQETYETVTAYVFVCKNIASIWAIGKFQRRFITVLMMIIIEDYKKSFSSLAFAHSICLSSGSRYSCILFFTFSFVSCFSNSSSCIFLFMPISFDSQ